MGSALRQPRTPPRADTVGSLLRPAPLKQAVESFYAPGHSAVLAEERRKDRAELRDLEDRAIRDAVRRQIDIGLDVVTDGEFRRWMFLNSFYDAVEGFRTDNVVHFRNARGEDVPLAVHEIVDRLRPVDSPAAREAAFLREATDGHPFKVELFVAQQAARMRPAKFESIQDAQAPLVQEQETIKAQLRELGRKFATGDEFAESAAEELRERLTEIEGNLADPPEASEAEMSFHAAALLLSLTRQGKIKAKPERVQERLSEA
ncbi:MAG TPA: hypothetical protein VI411_01110, partial [Actinomycetota bacterium]